jgi:hypothetical protein
MSQDDIREALRSAGRPLTLVEMARLTGLEFGTVKNQCAKMWRDHELYRSYEFQTSRRVRLVYYSFRRDAKEREEKAWRAVQLSSVTCGRE